MADAGARCATAVLITPHLVGALLLAFELRLIYYFWRTICRHAARLSLIAG